MKKLSDILYRVRLLAIHGKNDVIVSNIRIDSRKVTKGTAFIAIKGEKADGHKFIDNAVSSGASVIVCE